MSKKNERLMNVIIKPVITEKVTALSEKNKQIVFFVIPKSSKDEIKLAIEMVFKVKVESVRVLNQKGEIIRQRGKQCGQRKLTRKAYISLKSGQEINLMEMV